MIGCECRDIAALKRVLDEKRQELMASLSVRDPIRAERAPDPVDDLELALERDVATAQLERSFRQLEAVDEALARIRTGAYGACVRCGTAIPLARLQSIPWARHCLECQEAIDREGNGAVSGHGLE